MTSMTTAAMLPTPTGAVLVASPDGSLREQIRRTLDERRGQVYEAQGGADALAKLETGQWQVLYLDRQLPDLDAEELFAIIKLRFPRLAVVMMDSEQDAAPSAILQKASELPQEAPAQRPLAPAPDEKRPASVAAQPLPLAACPEYPEEVATLPGMIGQTVPMRRLYRLTRLVAPRPTTVLVLGATGTGKDLVARAVHRLSPRASAAFVIVNCAAIPEALLESELFGFVRGAFTGAVQTYCGKICAAQGGTLFLDEVGELPLGLQAKLLRFLDQKEIQRLGSAETLRVDVRVVAATNADLLRSVEEKRFREDLYYRLSAFPLELPSLAERSFDIPLLVEHFLRMHAAAARTAVAKLSPEALQRLQDHFWRGNVRELQQVIERAVILAEGKSLILPEHLHLV